MDTQVQRIRRGSRELPTGATRVRGAGHLPYDPRRPLRLPSDRRRRRPPQFRTGAILRLLLPIVVLAALGVGVFVGVNALLSDDRATPPTATTEPAAAATAADTAAAEAGSEAAAPIDAARPPAATVPTPEAAEPTAEEAAPPASGGIITAADVGGAPVVVDRGSVRAIPAGLPGRVLADGTPYDPTDDSVALSNTWVPGTVLAITRLPGAPLLSEEDAAQLVGLTIEVTVRGGGDFQEQIQLSAAAYQRLAREIEPIIAARIEVVKAAPRP